MCLYYVDRGGLICSTILSSNNFSEDGSNIVVVKELTSFVLLMRRVTFGAFFSLSGFFQFTFNSSLQQYNDTTQLTFD